MNSNTIFAERPQFTKKQDSGFLISIILLIGLGLITLYISSSGSALRIKGDRLHFVKRQLIYFSIGLAFMLAASFISLKFIKKILPFLTLAVIILCCLTFLPGIGVTLNGARRWIKFPLICRFQPSEIVKPVIVLFLANILSKEHCEGFEPVTRAAMMLFFFVFLVILQDDFSTAFFLMVIGLVMFFVSGTKIHWFVAFCVLTIPVGFLFIFRESYRVNRLIAFFNHGFDLHGLNYQVNMSRRAIAAGGFWGKGVNGYLRAVNSIPEVQADFIFAGWVEAMGFIGVLLYFALLIYFAFKGFTASVKCVDKFNVLTSFGLISCILIQSLLNVGVVSGALPSTGIPLPFFSSGGSSLIVTMLMCGLIFNTFRTDNKMKMESLYE